MFSNVPEGCSPELGEREHRHSVDDAGAGCVASGGLNTVSERVEMANVVLHTPGSSVSTPWVVCDSRWCLGLGSRCHAGRVAGWCSRNGRVAVCTAGQHPPEPRKDLSHIEGKPVSKKIPKTKKKKDGRGQVLPVLITVNRSDAKWADSWNTEQATTLKDLNLEELSTDSSFQGPGKLVHVELAVQKSGWGFFVQAQVCSTVRQQCSRCFKNYSSPINGSFQAWLTPTQDMFIHPNGKSEENGDPTVVYFPLGEEVADLTRMVRDTIKLNYTAKTICSEECDKLGPRTWEVGGLQGRPVDSRWLPLLKVKQNL